LAIFQQAALIAIMAQMGGWVPATEVVMCPFDAIYTRMGAFDDIAGGRSTFFVEVMRMIV
jgi:DNA mismatch repair protein MutS